MSNPVTYSRSTFNWLLALVLLTNIFSMPAFSGNSRGFIPQPFQTEEVFNVNSGETRRAVSLTVTLVSPRLVNAAFNYFDQVSADLNYNRFIKVKFNSLSEQGKLIRIAFSFIPSQRNPHSSEEDNSTLTAV